MMSFRIIQKIKYLSINLTNMYRTYTLKRKEFWWKKLKIWVKGDTLFIDCKTRHSNIVNSLQIDMHINAFPVGITARYKQYIHTDVIVLKCYEEAKELEESKRSGKGRIKQKESMRMTFIRLTFPIPVCRDF